MEVLSLVSAIERLQAQLGNRYTVASVTCANDPAVAPYRMKKVRDHHLSSQQIRKMLDAGEHWVVAMPSKVVHRAARGRHTLFSVLVSCDDAVINFLISALRDATHQQCPVFVVTKSLLDEVIGITLNHGIAAAALVNVTSTDAASDAVSETIPCCLSIKRLEPLLILDDVRSAENIGSILRTAFSLGVARVLCSRLTFQALNARSARVSMGALFHFKVHTALDIPAVLQRLKAQGMVVLGTSPTAQRALFSLPSDLDFTQTPWALVLGNEDTGLSTEVMASCSHVVTIPQTHGDSLSVVSAAAICIYELQRSTLSARQPHLVFIPDLP